MKVLELFRIPATAMMVVMLHSGDALAHFARTRRFLHGPDAHLVYGSMAIGMGLVFIAGPFIPRVRVFLAKRPDGSMEPTGPAWKVATVVFGIAFVALGFWIVADVFSRLR